MEAMSPRLAFRALHSPTYTSRMCSNISAAAYVIMLLLLSSRVGTYLRDYWGGCPSRSPQRPTEKLPTTLLIGIIHSYTLLYNV